MKKTNSILTILYIMFNLVGFSQNQIAVELIEAKIMYRGYKNRILISQDFCTNYTTEVIVVSNGTIEKSNEPEAYFVLPGLGRSLELAIVRKKHEVVVDTLRIVSYAVRNLPPPALYWGPYEDGAVINSSENFFFARYGGNIYLNAYFSVLKWTFHLGEKSISGVGKNALPIIEFIGDIGTPTKAIVIATVQGPNELEYEIKGEWIIMPGFKNK